MSPITEYLDIKLLAPNIENASEKKLEFDFEKDNRLEFLKILRQSVTHSEPAKDFWAELAEEK